MTSRASRTQAISSCGCLTLLASVALLVVACDRTEAPPVAPLAPFPAGELVAAAFPSDDQALVVARDGRIWLGDPRSGTFRRAHVPAVDGLAALAMADDRIGWAVGDGTVLRTDDGGARWERQRLPGPASEHRLVSVAAATREVAIAIDDRGRLISTTDAGGPWLRWPVLAEEGGAGGSGQVACTAGDTPRCIGVGVAGAVGVVALDPSTMQTTRLDVEPPAAPVVIAFDTGGSEPYAAGVATLEAAAAALADRPVSWRIDARVSADEVERVTTERDPGVLFDLIEGRAEEILGRLERAGVDGGHITLVEPPPWDYEDRLDDDPDALARYWRSRQDDSPRVVVRTGWDLAFGPIATGAASVGILVSGGEAGLFWRGEGAPSFERAEPPAGRRPMAMARSATGWIAVDGQGGIAWAPDSARAGGEHFTWSEPSVDGVGAFFDALRDVAVAPSGALSLVVGDQGRVLLSEDGGASWRALAPGVSSTTASVPIIR